ncbi:SH3 domain-containing protein [Humitalea sp. 24SJ18S-53]|uniref:SH3 domain-containing protein n=1 Tax=Humitalea sp. 24SJ18S-53 TaxID=3422307 RepID=UPI003D67373A
MTLALAGCDMRKDTSAAAERANTAASDRMVQAKTLAETALRVQVRGPSAIEFRGVQAYRQTIAHTVAICGQLNVRGPGQAFVPFVAVVTYPEEAANTANPAGVRIDPMVAMTSSEATRVYVEGLSRCLDNGGPSATRRGAPPPLPPIPADLPHATRPAPSPVAEAAAVLQPVGGFQPGPGEQAVILRQAGNVRMHPSGGGEVLRVIPRGNTVRVFSTAPGGWLQVGETQPFGWLHSSLVSAAGSPPPQ